MLFCKEVREVRLVEKEHLLVSLLKGRRVDFRFDDGLKGDCACSILNST